MRHFLITIVLTLLATTATAKSVADSELEFSMEAPDQASIQVDRNEQGRSLNVVYENPQTDDTFSVTVVRANNGGFNVPLFSFFERMMEGASDRLGKRPTVPLRRLQYRGHELFIAQHQGIGPSASQTMTKVVLLQERGAWRKVVALQLLTRGTRAPSDEFILGRLNALTYRPAA